MTQFRPLIEPIGAALDLLGVLIIAAGVLVAGVRATRAWTIRSTTISPYRLFRQDLGRAILLGLEFLVAGDIIRTVAVDPNIQNVGVLAVIVLIRTLLSFSLQVELEGRLPWTGQALPSQTTAKPATERPTD